MGRLLWQEQKQEKIMDIWHRLIELEKKSEDYGLAWPDAMQILQQIESECVEIREHLQQKQFDKKALQEEIGDLMHAVMSLAWYCQFDSYQTLVNSCDKFERRFEMIQLISKEQNLDNLKGLNFTQLMEIWNEAKKRLRVK